MNVHNPILKKILYNPVVFHTAKTLLRPLVFPRVLLCRQKYKRTLHRLRSAPKREKLLVMFLVGEPAKWKCQALYKAMEASELFDPIVGLTAWNSQSEYFCTETELEKQHKLAEEFFNRLGDRHVRTYSNFPRKGLRLRSFKPDIVFYSEPWLPIANQTPEKTAGDALCCFVPYFVPSTGDAKIVCMEDVHRFCHTYFTLSESWSEHYRSNFNSLNSVQTFVGTGLPALDLFSDIDKAAANGNMVIYAPHHSIPNPKNTIPWNISTFDWSGRPILEYAKKHPEFKWIFKPHPLLRREVVDAGLMSKDEIDRYYEEWSTIGEICLDGDYQSRFTESIAMVTDCGSFLSEYGATGHPLIRLIRTTNRQFPPPPGGLLDSFYQVRNLDELSSVFLQVLEKREDPMHDIRIEAVKRAGLAERNASANIIAYLARLCDRV